MKVTHESDKMSTENCGYLGHFRKSKFLKAGHNTVTDIAEKVIETTGKAFNTERGRAIKAAEKVTAPAPVDKTLRRKALDKAIDADDK